MIYSSSSIESAVQYRIYSLEFHGSHTGNIQLISYRNLWKYVTSSMGFAVHAHIRYFYATTLYRAGVDLKPAQYLLGHSDIKMTANIHTHVANEKIEDAAVKINSIFTEGS